MAASYHIEVEITDPKSVHDIVTGKPFAMGIFQDCIVLDRCLINTPKGSDDEGIVLIVRPHSFHPFVTWAFGWRDGELNVFSGHYLRTIDEAMADFNARVR